MPRSRMLVEDVVEGIEQLDPSVFSLEAALPCFSHLVPHLAVQQIPIGDPACSRAPASSPPCDAALEAPERAARVWRSSRCDPPAFSVSILRPPEQRPLCRGGVGEESAVVEKRHRRRRSGRTPASEVPSGRTPTMRPLDSAVRYSVWRRTPAGQFPTRLAGDERVPPTGAR